jgi:CRP/FNR family transcriptional regulator, cyclic AMP receptor protein
MFAMSLDEFSHLPIFSGLTQAQTDCLGHYLIPRSFPEHQTIFRQGEPTNYFYILTKGQVAIDFKPYDGPPLVVAHISPGGVFGVSAALGKISYSSSASTIKDCEALCLNGEKLTKIYMKNSETGRIFLERLASVLAERLNDTRTQILTMLTQEWCHVNHVNGGRG